MARRRAGDEETPDQGMGTQGMGTKGMGTQGIGTPGADSPGADSPGADAGGGKAGEGADPAAETGSEPERSTLRGAIASEIYEQVERILQEGVNKSEAFARIAGETGRRAATVAANYYRAARRRGEGAGRPAASQGRSSRLAGRRAVGGGEAAAIVERAGAAIEELSDLARRQEQELVRLRAESRQYEQIRTLIDGGRRPRGGGAG